MRYSLNKPFYQILCGPPTIKRNIYRSSSFVTVKFEVFYANSSVQRSITDSLGYSLDVRLVNPNLMLSDKDSLNLASSPKAFGKALLPSASKAGPSSNSTIRDKFLLAKTKKRNASSSAQTSFESQLKKSRESDFVPTFPFVPNSEAITTASSLPIHSPTVELTTQRFHSLSSSSTEA